MEFRDWLVATWGEVLAWLQGLWERYGEAIMHTFESIRDDAVEFAANVIELVTYIGEFFIRVWQDIAAWFESNGFLEDIIAAFSDFWAELEELTKPFLRAVRRVSEFIMRIFRGIIIPFLHATVTFIEAIWNRFGDNILDILETAWDLVIGIFNAALDIIVGIIRTVVSLINGDFEGVKEGIIGIFRGMWDAIFEVFRAAVSFIGDIVRTIVDVITIPFAWLYDTLIGNSIIPDIVNGIIRWFGQLLTWLLGFFASLPGRLLGLLRSAAEWLLDAGRRIATGLWNGIVAAAEAIWRWFGSIDDTIKNLFIDALVWLLTDGREIISGLWNGAKEVFTSVISWFQGLPRRIVTQLGNVGRLLFDIGKDILQSLWDGMKAIWDNMTGWLGDIAGEIVERKGPPSKDARLLYENGKLIMQGLGRGLEDGWKAVADQLQGYSTGLSGNMTSTFDVRSSHALQGAMMANTYGGHSAPLIAIENATFGDENVVEDLNWFAQTTLSGV
jgi:phage-related protein